MILREILLAKRIKGYFYIDGFTIKADRVSSPGYGVLCVFEPSKLDKDFQVLGYGYYWFPTAKALEIITEQLDLSDRMTCDNLRKGEGWEVGPRPFKLQDFI